MLNKKYLCRHKDSGEVFEFESIDDFVEVIKDGLIQAVISLREFYNTYTMIRC